MHRFPAIRVFYVSGPPTFIRNQTMDFEIFGARAQIKPLSFLENDASDSSALRDPISENWNKRDFFLWRDPRKNRRIPDRDVCEIVGSGDAVSVGNIDHAMFTKGDRG